MKRTTLAVIGGSRAYDLLSDGSFGRPVKTVKPKTPYGKSAPVRLFEGKGYSFWFLSRHGEKGYDLSAPFVNYRANIFALKEIGVEQVVSWSGPGAINPRMKPGDLVLPDDVIDQTKNRVSTFYENTGMGFIRMDEPFCPGVRKAVASSLPPGVKPHRKGTYLCTEGPRLETRAEIRMFAGWGADLVGMTLLPEAFLAREMEICYAPLCYVTNYAEGVRRRGFRTGELFEGMQTDTEKKRVETTLRRFPAILKKTMLALSKAKRDCNCGSAMQRYREKGLL